MNFMNLAKQGYEAYQESQSGHQGQDQSQPIGVQGSAALNSNDNNRPTQAGLQLDHDQVTQHASNFSGGQDSSLFSTALSFLNSQGDDGEDLDEQGIQQAHDKAYNQGEASSLGSKSLGAAAAMQALKSFTSGGGDQQSSSSGGSFQTKLISMAMAEAAKLFDQKGGAADGNKQDVVNGAAQAMMKLVLKNQVSGMMGAGSEGGASGGGMSQLLGMAKQFM